MKKLIIIAVIALVSLTASAVEITKSGKVTTLVFKSKTEMQKTFSFQKAGKAHTVNSVTSQNGKIVIVLTRKF